MKKNLLLLLSLLMVVNYSSAQGVISLTSPSGKKPVKSSSSNYRSQNQLRAKKNTNTRKPTPNSTQLTGAQLVDMATDAFEKGNYANDFIYSERAVQKGAAIGYHSLANCYFWASGYVGTDDVVEKYRALANKRGVYNYMDKAISLWNTAADKGSTDAMVMLGDVYAYGLGVDANSSMAAKWKKRAADLGNAQGENDYADYLLQGYGVEQDEAAAFRFYMKAADQGLDEAVFNVGMCYYYGRSVQENNVEALKHFRRAANNNYSPAIYFIGECYLYGYGVEANEATAFSWYKKAAENGYGEAQYVVGKMYIAGAGVTQNAYEGVNWLRKGANNGNTNCETGLAGQYFKGEGVGQDYEAGVKWLLKAAEDNDTAAEQLLGYSYANGLGVIKDNQKAYVWFKKAADKGDLYSQDWLFYNFSEGVDLGLSVLWAPCNLGSSSHADADVFLGWGDATGKQDSENLKYYGGNNPPASISGNTLYDVAAALTNGQWRIPTSDEFKELFEKCSLRWDSQQKTNGAYSYGYLVTGPNGNRIFIPVTDSIQNEGVYWTGDLYPQDKKEAILMNIKETNYDLKVAPRNYHLAIRPVMKKTNNTSVLSVNGNTLQTESHNWNVSSVQCLEDRTIVTKIVRAKSSPTYVFSTPEEFIEDALTGKKYYLQGSDIGLTKGEYILHDTSPHTFSERYPALPTSVKYINISSGSFYFVKNLQIR